MGQNYSGMVAADTQIDRNYDSTNTNLSLSQTPDDDLDQNYSNIVAPDDQLTYRDLYLNAMAGGGMPEGYPTETKELYNGTVNVPSGSSEIPLFLSNDDFDNWTVLINGNEAPKTFADGCPAYGWFDDDYLGIVDATMYGEGILFLSDLTDTDHTLVITQTTTDPNFVEGVKNAIDELDYPYEHSETEKYNTSVTITENDDNGVIIDGIPADADLTQYDVYVNDIRMTYYQDQDAWMCVLSDGNYAQIYYDNGYYLLTLSAPDYTPVAGDYTIEVIEDSAALNKKFHNGVDDVLSEYNLATPTVIKYDGDITIYDGDIQEPIPFAQGTDLSDYQSWTVTIDDHTLEWSGFDKTFTYEDSDNGIFYGVGDYRDDNIWVMSVCDTTDWNGIPGTYHLTIKIAGHANVSSNVEVVTITNINIDGGGNRAPLDPITADKTYAQLLDAYNAGKIIFAYLPEIGTVLPMAWSIDNQR